MATLKKTYVIEVQLDNARQQLADAVQKLQQLDAELEGLDQSSEAGKKLVAEMAAAAKSVQGLTSEVEGLADQLDMLKPGTVGALEAEVEQLEAAFKKTVVGSKEQQQALLALGNAKGQLTALNDAVDALNPKEKVAAFADFANGIVGGFSIATTAAQSWGGLSAESAEEVEKRLQSLLVVMSGFEAISKATNSETIANVKNTFALAKNYLFAGEAASTSSKVVRGALAATGIGLIVLLVGTLVANWEALSSKVKGSEKFFTTVRAVASGLFDSAIASVKNFTGVIGKLFDGDFSGALVKAKNIGKEAGKAFESGYQEVLDDEARKLIAKQVEVQERLLKVQQAGGFDSDKLQREILVNKLAQQKKGNEAETKLYNDAATELAAFDAAQAKKRRETALANTLARINATVALEQARGQDAYAHQLQQKRAELAGLLASETQNEAAIRSKRGEIDAFQAQHAAEVAEKKRAALVLAQQNQLAILDKQGKDTLALRLAFAEQLLAVDADGTEKARAQRDADYQALLLLQEEYNGRVRDGLKANIEQRQEIEEQGREADRKFAEGAGAAAQDAYLAGLAKDGAKANQKTDIGRSILTNFFGVKSEDVERVKADLNQAFADISQSVGGAVNAALTSGMIEADAQLQAVQARLTELDSQLSAASSARESTQAALENATGARKAFLLDRLGKERAAEQALAGEKAKANREAESAAKTKAKLEKEQQQISAASTAIEAVLLGIKAAQTLVDISAKGKFGFDNIALAIAAAASLGAGIFAMKSAAKTFESGTGALGSDGVLSGPTHKQGGIGLYSRYGHFYGEAEHGEAISPADSSRNNANALALIRTKGRTRTLTPADFAEMGNVRVLPPPTGAGYYANGTGGLGGGGGSRPAAGQVTITTTDLTDLLDTNRALLGTNQAMLAHLQSIGVATAQTASFGPPKLQIGSGEAVAIRNEATKADQDERAATL